MGMEHFTCFCFAVLYSCEDSHNHGDICIADPYACDFLLVGETIYTYDNRNLLWKTGSISHWISYCTGQSVSFGTCEDLQ